MVFTGLDNFPATDQGDVGGQHPRAAPAFMSCMHPKQTEGADVEAGTTIDQIIAERICRDTKLQSLEVSVDRNDVVGACDHGYACAYMNSLAWKNPTTPLPSETNPRFVFERLFGIGATAEERQARVDEDRSILDGLTQQISRLQRAARMRGTAPSWASISTPCATSSSASPRPNPTTAISRCPTSRSACLRLPGIRRVDVRSAGAGVPGRHHARQLVHDGARKHQPLVSGDRPARGASLDVAPRQQPGEDEERSRS